MLAKAIVLLMGYFMIYLFIYLFVYLFMSCLTRLIVFLTVQVFRMYLQILIFCHCTDMPFDLDLRNFITKYPVTPSFPSKLCCSNATTCCH